MYSTTDGSELSNYILRPKIGNIYKFSLVFNESMKLKRLLNIELGEKRKINVSLLSATFSKLLIELLDKNLLIQNESDTETRSNWLSLFTKFEPEDELYRKFNPLKVGNESVSKPISRWFLES